MNQIDNLFCFVLFKKNVKLNFYENGKKCLHEGDTFP